MIQLAQGQRMHILLLGRPTDMEAVEHPRNGLDENSTM